MNFKNKSLLKTALLSVSGANGNLRIVNSQIGSTIDARSFLTHTHKSHDMWHVTNGVRFNFSTQLAGVIQKSVLLTDGNLVMRPQIANKRL